MSTEKQARELWCPMVRASTTEDDGNASNAGSLAKSRSPIFARCIASQCAMWRWAKIAERFGPNSTGYCGLAGKHGGVE